ncbi:hypothetical protein PSUB009319_05790 [Ralstonia sp. SET104]|nr:hypothetical protein PSUB009319_05790 [Ralstonia sp. SET104]
MDYDSAEEAHALRQFVRNIARLNAHGDRLQDGQEVVWDERYSLAQLWEVISSARLLAGACPSNTSAFFTPMRRPAPHHNVVRTYPDDAFDED